MTCDWVIEKKGLQGLIETVMFKLNWIMAPHNIFVARKTYENLAQNK